MTSSNGGTQVFLSREITKEKQSISQRKMTLTLTLLREIFLKVTVCWLGDLMSG